MQDADQFDFGTNRWDPVCLLYSPGAEEVHDFANRWVTSLKPRAFVISEGPYVTPKTLSELASAWSDKGLRLLPLEYREEQSDWGQPNFGPIAIPKSKTLRSGL